MPEGFDDVEEELIISAILFHGSGLVETQFAEKKDNNEVAGMTKNGTLDMFKSGNEELFNDLMSVVRDVVDATYIAIRNPPTKIRRSRGVTVSEPDTD